MNDGLVENDDIVEIECEFKHETENAVLVLFEGEKTWFPKSQLFEFESFSHGRGDNITLNITEWIAEQKGIE